MYLEDDQMKLLFERIHRWLKPQGELFFRESCRVKRIKNTTDGYYANYRTLFEYDQLVKDFTLVKEGHIQAYVHAFADPLQCYWHCKRELIQTFVIFPIDHVGNHITEISAAARSFTQPI